MTPRAAAKRDALFAALRAGPQLMGIVNVTPDSFSDGGRFLDAGAATAEATRHVAGGAAVIDIGAESTRPGYAPVPAEEEAARLAPVLACLIEDVDVAVSIDTTKATIADLALDAGAALVNDQWGLQRDTRIAEVAATADAGLVLMHNCEGLDPTADVVDEMCRFFDRSLALAARAGVKDGRVILDPGIGFGKSRAQNARALSAGIAALKTFGCPVMAGVSRKSFLAALTGAQSTEDRLFGTIAANLAAFRHGARLFRVHDCAPHRDAFAVTVAIDHA